MAEINFSKDELSFIKEVQESTDSNKQSIFEKYCAKIQDKTRIGVLALFLGLSPNALANDTQTGEKIEANPQVLAGEKKQILSVQEEFDSKYGLQLKQLGGKDTPAGKAFYNEKITQIINEKLDILIKQLPEKMQKPMFSSVNKFPIVSRMRYVDINIEIINKLGINVATEIYRDLYVLVHDFILAMNTDINNDKFLLIINNKIEESLNKLYSKYPELKNIKSLYDFSKIVRLDQNERIIKDAMSSGKK